MVAVLPILGKPATATEPANGPLDNPAQGFNDEALGMIGTSDNFDHQVWHGVGDTMVEDRPRVSAVGEQLAEERKLPERRLWGGQRRKADLHGSPSRATAYGDTERRLGCRIRMISRKCIARLRRPADTVSV